MGVWRLNADLLASSRFVLSPLAETVAAMTMLAAPSEPWQVAFRDTNRAAYDEMLAAHPVRRAVAARSWRPRAGRRPGMVAEFLAVVPIGEKATIDEELAAVRRRFDDDAVRSALLEVDPAPLQPELVGDGVADAAVALVRWIWTTTLAADWPRRQRVLRGDVASRSAQLATAGWSGVLPTLGKRRRWLGGGRLQISEFEGSDEDLAGVDVLYLVPVHSSGTWWTVDRQARSAAVVYPVTGPLAQVAGVGGDGLSRLIGTNRGRLLRLLDAPRSTTTLMALTGLPQGSVGNHLRVLLDAGLVLRRRAGREVLYWRTAPGDALVAASGPDRHRPS